MTKHPIPAAVLGVALTLQPLTGAWAAVYAERLPAVPQASQAETVQYWRGGPGFRGAWRGPPGWRGRPYWYSRPWVRRPYYGTVIAGVALGTLITVAAVGAVPPRPAPNLCWYWADPYGNRGYWDYC
jgi:hypothetical protein